MRSPFRNRRAAAKVADLRTALTVSEAMRRDSEARQREAAAKRAADARDHLETIIDGIATDFYVASAIHTWSAPNRHQVGVMDGLIQAMSRVTGKDPIATGFQMERGIPQGDRHGRWVAVIDVIDGRDVPVLLHDGVREPVTDRLAALHKQALIAKNHPLAHIDA